MTEEKIIRTYAYPCSPNKGKAQKVERVLAEYRKTAQDIAKLQWHEFFRNGKFNKYLKIKALNSLLSARYKQTCQWQVVGVLDGYLARVQEEFEKIVHHSTLNQKSKRVLTAINSRKVWFGKDLETISWFERGDRIDYQVTREEMLLARKIFKSILRKWRRPRFKRIAMHLDAKVAMVEENESSVSFDKWLKLSTLDKGKPVLIPLKNNAYAEGIDGRYLNFYQVQEEDGDLIVRLVKELERRDYRPIVPEIGIDLGLNPLFATDRGDLIGRKFLGFLAKSDDQITKRMAYLQKIGRRPSQDKKYSKLVRRLRDFLENEINRHINRLVELYRPARIVVERLDFRGQNLSRRMNRLLSRFGKRIVGEKLKSLQELYGIEIVETNPAYSSQECASCGYIDEKNRKNTHGFECQACGRKRNAQVNAARNILRRRSVEGITVRTPKKQVLEVLVKRHLERLRGWRSAPLRVLKENPYYRDLRDFLDGLSKPLECG